MAGRIVSTAGQSDQRRQIEGATSNGRIVSSAGPPRGAARYRISGVGMRSLKLDENCEPFRPFIALRPFHQPNAVGQHRFSASSKRPIEDRETSRSPRAEIAAASMKIASGLACSSQGIDYRLEQL